MDQAPSPIRPKILVSPLDWGLGHATRCIPIIHQLLEKNCEVLLAGEGKIRRLLEAEFPELEFLDLKGYRIKYTLSPILLAAKMLLQIPKIFSSIKEENKWLQRVVEMHAIDAVISDNRYGLFHKKIYSVFITHQLKIKTWNGVGERLLQKINYQYINRFNECWVPDEKGEINLGGELSHPSCLPKTQVSYTGILSRFKKRNTLFEEKHLLILLSGPEPQRSLLEGKILQDLESYKEPVVLVRGLPGYTSLPQVKENVQIHNHLNAKDIKHYVDTASFLIARSGYSTVMDLMKVGKKSILIPTPGQTEQEYLAYSLMQKKFAFSIPQSKFKLHNAIELAKSFDYKFPILSNDNLEIILLQLIQKLRNA